MKFQLLAACAILMLTSPVVHAFDDIVPIDPGGIIKEGPIKSPCREDPKLCGSDAELPPREPKPPPSEDPPSKEKRPGISSPRWSGGLGNIYQRAAANTCAGLSCTPWPGPQPGPQKPLPLPYPPGPSNPLPPTDPLPPNPWPENPVPKPRLQPWATPGPVGGTLGTLR